MRKITVEKYELMEIIRKNRDAHRGIFEEALEGYKDQAVRLLEQHISEIRTGKVVQVQVFLPTPEDHTSDYDRVLRMLEMSIDAKIEIDEDEFASYVMDDWHWKNAFLKTNSAYSSTARLSLGR